jgi:UDP-N-acetylmuramyl tripeptide synthase
VLRDGRAHGPGTDVPLRVALPGRYNEGNALAALAAATALGADPGRAAAAMARLDTVASRYALLQRGSQQLRLLLAKNPAGWRELLPQLRSSPALLLAVNRQAADGRDTSWLWDVPFEQLPGVPTVAAGQAAADLGLRLAYADRPHTTAADPVAGLAALPPGPVTVVANYTAFAQLVRRLDRAA